MAEKYCDCEHIDHFEPVKYPHHKHGEYAPVVAKVKTTYGTFNFCAYCLTTHIPANSEIEYLD